MDNDAIDGRREMISRVREAMTVYDAAGEKLGTVREVYIGDGGEPASADRQAREAIADVRAAIREPDRPLDTGDIEAVGVGGLSGDGGRPLGPLTGDAAIDPREPDRRVAEGPMGAQVPDDDLPRGGRERLMREGYLRIDSAGLFAADRYAGAWQITRVDGDEVWLRVAGDALLTTD